MGDNGGGYAGRHARWREGRVRDGGVGVGVETELRRQLRDKDELLRQIERQRTDEHPPVSADMVLQVVGELQSLRDVVMQVISLQRNAAGVPVAMEELVGRVEVLESMSNTHCVQLRGLEDRVVEVEGEHMHHTSNVALPHVASSSMCGRAGVTTPVPPLLPEGAAPCTLTHELEARMADVERDVAELRQHRDNDERGLPQRRCTDGRRALLGVTPLDVKSKGLLELQGRQDGIDARLLRVEEMVADSQNSSCANGAANEGMMAARRQRVEDRMMDVELRLDGIERRLERIEVNKGDHEGVAALEARVQALEAHVRERGRPRGGGTSPDDVYPDVQLRLGGILERVAALEESAQAAPSQLRRLERDIMQRLEVARDEHQSNMLAIHDRVGVLTDQHTKAALQASADRQEVERSLELLVSRLSTAHSDKAISPPQPLRTRNGPPHDGTSRNGLQRRSSDHLHPSASPSSASVAQFTSVLEVLTDEWQRRERAGCAPATPRVQAVESQGDPQAELKAKVGAFLKALDSERGGSVAVTRQAPQVVSRGAALQRQDVAVSIRTRPYEGDDTASLPTTMALPSTPMYTPVGKLSCSNSPSGVVDHDAVSSVAASVACSTALNASQPPLAPASSSGTPRGGAATPTPERRQRSGRFNVPQRNVQ